MEHLLGVMITLVCIVIVIGLTFRYIAVVSHRANKLEKILIYPDVSVAKEMIEAFRDVPKKYYLFLSFFGLDPLVLFSPTMKSYLEDNKAP